MLPTEKIELAIYQFVRERGASASLSLGDLHNATGVDPKSLRDVLQALHKEAQIVMYKRDGDTFSPYSAFLGSTFFAEGSFVIEICPDARKYFEKLEQDDAEERLGGGRSTTSKVTNVYHVYGHNPHWNVNSQDHSINVVTATNEQIFAKLRQEISSRIPVGEEQSEILERLAALEQAAGSSSFAQQYTAFISGAANHITLLAPFIPALAEMLHKALYG
jgi:hypothetical protein